MQETKPLSELRMSELERLKSIHGVLVVSKETGTKGLYVLREMSFPEWITSERLAIEKGADSIEFRQLSITERNAVKQYVKGAYGSKKGKYSRFK